MCTETSANETPVATATLTRTETFGGVCIGYQADIHFGTTPLMNAEPFMEAYDLDDVDNAERGGAIAVRFYLNRGLSLEQALKLVQDIIGTLGYRLTYPVAIWKHKRTH